MKKQLLTLSLMIMSLCMFSQSTIWKPHDAAIDSFNVMGCRYLWAVDSNTVWSMFYDGTYTTRAMNKVTVTHNGNTFKSYNILPDTNNFNASNIVGVNDSVAFVAMYSKDATRNGIIMMTMDSGKTWMNIADTSFMFVGGNNFPDVVHFYDNMNGWALGDPNGNTGGGSTNEFEIYRTSNMGGTWTRVPDANIPNPLSGEYGLTNVYTTFGTQNIWFGTGKGRVYHSTDGGNTWTASSVGGMAAGVEGLAFRDAMNGLVWGINTSGGPTVMKKTTNGGATWTSITITGSTTLGTYDLCAIPGRGAYMSVGATPSSATSFVTSVSTDDGATWTILEQGTTNTERMLKVMMLDSAHGWAGTFADQTSPWTLGINNYIGPKMQQVCPMSVSGNTVVCSGNSVTLTASGADTYTWSTNAGSANTNTVTVTPSATDTYTMIGTAYGTCKDTVMYSVTVNATPTVSAVVGTPTICALNSTQITASGGTTYQWTPATGLNTTTSGTVTGYYTTAGTYTYNVTGTTSGCSSVAQVTVTVLPCTGIAENTNALANIFPNPSNGAITIDFGKAAASTKVIVSDMIGNQVYQNSVIAGTSKLNIDLSTMPKGIYLVTVTNALGAKSVHKMIVE